MHRTRQFAGAGREPSDADFALAREQLPPALFALFARQHPRDIVHAAATARWLLTRGYSQPDLVLAALLHDVGKGEQRRIDRVVYVLADAVGAAGRVASPASGSPFGGRWRGRGSTAGRGRTSSPPRGRRCAPLN